MNKSFMKLAIEEAKKAAAQGEIPVGAVIVKNGEVVSKAHNTRERQQNALGHAEINAIKEACEKLGSWRLDDCEIYVTMEPCPMCAGAIINARIPTVVFGCYDLKMGAIDSVCALCSCGFDFKPEIYAGIMEKECSALVKSFFVEMRNTKQ